MNQLKKDSIAFDIFNAIKDLNIFGTSDESFVHRFAYKYTAMVFLISFIMHSFTLVPKDKDKDYTSIYCIYPNEISTTEAQIFSKMYCWSSNTYYIPHDYTLPNKGEPRSNRITYYQWVPWILVICSALSTAPFKAWHYFTKSSPFDLEQIMSNVVKAKKEIDQTKSLLVQNQINKLMSDSMEDYHNYMLNLKCFRKFYSRNYLIMLYMAIRFFYLVTTFTLFFLLNLLLGQNFFGLYGFNVIKDIYDGKYGAVESSFFPRITMCDVPIRSTGHNINWYVVQCVLPINFFNEKIFIVLWFWNAFVLIGTVISTILWFISNFCLSRSFIKSFLNKDCKNSYNTKTMNKFLTCYLTHDVIFILHVIKKKGNYKITSQVISELWKKHLERLPKIEKEEKSFFTSS